MYLTNTVFSLSQNCRARFQHARRTGIDRHHRPEAEARFHSRESLSLIYRIYATSFTRLRTFSKMLASSDASLVASRKNAFAISGGRERTRGNFRIREIIYERS